ncbi:uncharacterized protein BT62DRAFT_998829 [Guyanagaster necrorhizus]|uniref:Uncharacterized protein n=1 Tax=Guyanagaster necrorhizus TaxID=856835 RepID=A0A9P7W558_9AGAR|nr:uncharacterized protein BT62DRAFT_998829 [Guyanagaster necrorhizus MCA 3950]KAG7452807.1 hypothetical protein BT62DRAFT_998829 [Guyanagaster necrorhizus MCA 3950]
MDWSHRSFHVPVLAFQNTSVTLHSAQFDPFDFVLGASTNNINESVMVATTIQVVANFTADRIVDMTFNYTSPSTKDCTRIAWLLEADPRNRFAESESFTVTASAKANRSLWYPFNISITVSIPVSSWPTASNRPASRARFICHGLAMTETSFHQECEIKAQEPLSEDSKGEDARMPGMEGGYGSSPPPSYRSAFSASSSDVHAGGRS